MQHPLTIVPFEICDESPDGPGPSLWVHPGVLAKVLHHMEVRTSLLTQAYTEGERE